MTSSSLQLAPTPTTPQIVASLMCGAAVIAWSVASGQTTFFSSATHTLPPQLPHMMTQSPIIARTRGVITACEVREIPDLDFADCLSDRDLWEEASRLLDEPQRCVVGGWGEIGDYDNDSDCDLGQTGKNRVLLITPENILHTPCQTRAQVYVTSTSSRLFLWLQCPGARRFYIQSFVGHSQAVVAAFLNGEGGGIDSA